MRYVLGLMGFSFLIIGGIFLMYYGKGEDEIMMELTSTSITNGESLKVDQTCDGKNVSPPLAWSGVPSGAKSFSIICDDPDAPSKVWVHWVVFNIPGNVTQLPEGVSSSDASLSGTLLGQNDFGKLEYGGACPPPGHGVHRYTFTLYALDAMLSLQAGAARADVEEAMTGHILAKAQLIGTYAR